MTTTTMTTRTRTLRPIDRTIHDFVASRGTCPPRRYSRCNVFTSDRVHHAIYSFGHHWAVAAFIPGPDLTPTLLINGDLASPATNRHTSTVFNIARARNIPYLTISFSALGLAIIGDGDPNHALQHTHLALLDAIDKGHLRLIDSSPDSALHAPNYRFESWERDDTRSASLTPPGPTTGYTVRHFKPKPNTTTFDQSTDGLATWSAHRPASALFRYTRPATPESQKDDRSLLLGMDEGSYFVSQLPVHPPTLDLAYRSLVPKSLRSHLDANLPFIRQGEWFFVPHTSDTSVNTIAKADRFASRHNLSRSHALPRPGSKYRPVTPNPKRVGFTYNDGGIGNLHIPTRCYLNRRKPSTLYVYGIVRHDSRRGRRRPEHRPADLRSLGLCTAHVNTAIRSWSSLARGGVD